MHPNTIKHAYPQLHAGFESAVKELVAKLCFLGYADTTFPSMSRERFTSRSGWPNDASVPHKSKRATSPTSYHTISRCASARSAVCGNGIQFGPGSGTSLRFSEALAT